MWSENRRDRPDMSQVCEILKKVTVVGELNPHDLAPSSRALPASSRQVRPFVPFFSFVTTCVCFMLKVRFAFRCLTPCSCRPVRCLRASLAQCLCRPQSSLLK
jgi:hypothetical protein